MTWTIIAAAEIAACARMAAVVASGRRLRFPRSAISWASSTVCSAARAISSGTSIVFDVAASTSPWVRRASMYAT
ncbi:MAG TPA: hypothetical protein VKE27_00855 [Candidatus Dormibacteraeota bacterium]|nr:hypothetical protein [Candidatus Dormibacteraeota bacterium]